MTSYILYRYLRAELKLKYIHKCRTVAIITLDSRPEHEAKVWVKHLLTNTGILATPMQIRFLCVRNSNVQIKWITALYLLLDRCNSYLVERGWYQISHSFQKRKTETHPAFVCDMELVRICIVKSKQRRSIILSVLNVNQGWFVLQPSRSGVRQSQRKKVTLRRQRNAPRDAVIWDYWAEQSTYHIAISLSLGSHYCQKGAASAGCAETAAYLFH